MAKMESEILISIVDWGKFNPRTDSKSHTWFRLENDFFFKTFSWRSEEQILFSYLCCCRSKAKQETFILDLRLACALLKRKEKQVLSDLDSLQSYGVLTLSNSKLLDVTTKSLQVTTSDLVPTYERTIRTIRTDDTNKCSASELFHLADIWNANTHQDLPKVKECKGDRLSSAKARWSEHPHDDYWLGAIKKINESDFCLGQSKNSKGWTANFNWLIRPETSTKLLEGQYDNPKTKKVSIPGFESISNA